MLIVVPPLLIENFNIKHIDPLFFKYVSKYLEDLENIKIHKVYKDEVKFLLNNNRLKLYQVKKFKGNAILTSKKPQTGTDRIWEAFTKLNLRNIDYIINLQGDEPLIDIDDIKNLDTLSKNNNCKINTLASEINKKELFHDSNIVKVITKDRLENKKLSLAKNFFLLPFEIHSTPTALLFSIKIFVTTVFKLI